MLLRLGGGDAIANRGRQHCMEDDSVRVSLILLGLLV